MTARQLKDLSSLLIDIHGQHEHQSLLSNKKQLGIVDRYAGEPLQQVLDVLKAVAADYAKLKREYEEGLLDDTSRVREMDLAQYELEEITNAKLKIGEDEDLEADYRRMVHAQKISESVGLAHELCGYDNGSGAGSLISRALRELRSVSSYDDAVKDMEQQLVYLESLLSDFGRQSSDYLDELIFDPALFAEIENRLNLINHLKDKYGATIEQVIAYGEKLEMQMEKYADYDSWLQKMQEKLAEQKSRMLMLCKQASEIRQSAATELENLLQDALQDLNFLHAKFEISILANEENMSANGYDYAEYLISTNPGESCKPLAQIASGGELSRVMLALKTVLAEKDAIETLIFDEIDSGISGKTAWKVSEKIGLLGKNHQIICITHLPQIAAMADTHFLIEKKVQDGRTVTDIGTLDTTGVIEELSRMLGSEEITDSARENAKELLTRAAAVKA